MNTVSKRPLPSFPSILGLPIQIQPIWILPMLLLLAACGGKDAQPDPAPSSQQHPADAFLARLAEHCGQAFAGQIVANEPADDDDPFAGKPLIMHVRKCGDGFLEVPFHVGEDHSRTWLLTRTDTGLRLKHDHRHADGSHDELTMYGGDTATAGTPQRQAFPVDTYSIEMFERLGSEASVTNTWVMEIEPRQRFLYELSRPGGRLFRVEFDLTTPVDLPPTPWGHPEL